MIQRDPTIEALESMIRTLRAQLETIDEIMKSVNRVPSDYTEGEKTGLRLAIKIAETMIELRKKGVL